jgi:hypothetical protein
MELAEKINAMMLIVEQEQKALARSNKRYEQMKSELEAMRAALKGDLQKPEDENK